MFQALRNSPALRLLLLAGAGVLAFILAVHFFAKKQTAPAGTSTAGNGADTTDNAPEHITVLINGYPAMQTPPGIIGGGTSNPTTPAPTPIPPRPVPPRPTLPPAPQTPPQPTSPSGGGYLTPRPIIAPIAAPPTSAQLTSATSARLNVLSSPVRAPVQATTVANPSQVAANISVSQARVAAADAKVNPPTYHKPAPKPAPRIITAVRNAGSAVRNRTATVNSRLAAAGF